jgi:hypothetical protein
MTRLKYYSSAPGLLYTDWFTLGPNLIVRGIINLDTYTYQVYEFDSEMMSHGEAPNLRVAKEKLKELLVTCGVNFDGEIRKRV